MFNYHATLTATHPYSSSWWTWPLMLKPVWLYVSYLPLSMKSTIALLGNPAVWGAGFVCVILAVERAVRKRDLACMFITSFFFFQWLPYALISRVTFLYHFYVSVPFLCLASAYFLSKYWSTKWGKVAAVAYFASVVVMFGLFYSVISGMPASTLWIDSLKWLNGWSF
jgi:dolichyl-phosphate-mannose-protein mannosyltransferase